MPNSTNSNNLLFFVLMGAVVAFMFFSSRKRKKQVASLADSVKVGANVVMLGGITGKITAINDDTVVIETTPGTKIEFMKAAVRNVVAPSTDKPAAVAAKKPAATKTSATTTATTKSSATKKTAK